jgi:hypothetical protein
MRLTPVEVVFTGLGVPGRASSSVVGDRLPRGEGSGRYHCLGEVRLRRRLRGLAVDDAEALGDLSAADAEDELREVNLPYLCDERNHRGGHLGVRDGVGRDGEKFAHDDGADGHS